MRYSTPWCAPLLKLGDTCRPSSTQLKNVTLTYPGGLEIFLKDAYQVIEWVIAVNDNWLELWRFLFLSKFVKVLCPCDASQGLVCSPINGTCIVDFQIATNDIVRWNIPSAKFIFPIVIKQSDWINLKWNNTKKKNINKKKNQRRHRFSLGGGNDLFTNWNVIVENVIIDWPWLGSCLGFCCPSTLLYVQLSPDL